MRRTRSKKLKFQFNPVNIISIFLLLICSYSLLTYVGEKESEKGYPILHLERILAEGEIIQSSIERFLIAGESLNKFLGFERQAKSLINTSPSIKSIAVFDTEKSLLFKNTEKEFEQRFAEERQVFIQSNFPLFNKIQSEIGYHLDESENYFRLYIPLRNRFEQKGALSILVDRSPISQQIEVKFRYVWYLVGVLIVIFMIFSLLRNIGSKKFDIEKDFNLIRITFGVNFFILFVFVVYQISSLYSAGVESKVESITKTLQYRLEAPLLLGLDLESFTGINQTFVNYKNSNEDISYIALTKGKLIQYHSDSSQVGKKFKEKFRYFESNAFLGGPENNLKVHVGIPKSVIILKLWKGLKNFLVLFFATTLISFLFIKPISIYKAFKLSKSKNKKILTALGNSYIRPIYFLSLFAEWSYVSFLPIYFRDSFAGLNDNGKISLLFSAFFTSYSLTLMFGNRIVRFLGTKLHIIVFILLCAAMHFSLFLFKNFEIVLITRIFAGMCQCLLYMGVQSYLRTVTKDVTERIQILVHSNYAAYIAGASIGALLVFTFAPKGIFFMSFMICIFLALYTIFLLPTVKVGRRKEKNLPAVPAFRSYVSNLLTLISDGIFLKTSVLVGLLSRTIIAGVNVFVLPLYLSKLDFIQEEIGQITMFYAIGIVISNYFSKKIVGKASNKDIIFFGTLISGFSLCLFGLVDNNLFGFANKASLTILIIVGIFVLGLAHGAIMTPVIKNIFASKAGTKVGRPTFYIYKLIERIGYALGPVVLSFLFYRSDESISMILYLGIIVIISSVIFKNSAQPVQRRRI